MSELCSVPLPLPALSKLYALKVQPQSGHRAFCVQVWVHIFLYTPMKILY